MDVLNIALVSSSPKREVIAVSEREKRRKFIKCSNRQTRHDVKERVELSDVIQFLKFMCFVSTISRCLHFHILFFIPSTSSYNPPSSALLLVSLEKQRETWMKPNLLLIARSSLSICIIVFSLNKLREFSPSVLFRGTMIRLGMRGCLEYSSKSATSSPGKRN